jgi:Pex14 N-terminal domain
MTDPSAPKRPAIPDWQMHYVQPSATPEPLAKDPPSNSNDAPSSDTGLLELARRWLKDESIRDSPRERKIAFLEEKGLQGDDIQKLLGTEDILEREPEMKTVHDSASSASTMKASSPTLPTPKSTPSTTSSRDVPPIITYPEFLLRPEKPPPLVTFQRLAYATYGLAGLTALTYGASKYLVQPMLDSLTSARREFADTALQNLEKLNSKLESNVSHVPYLSSSAVLKRKAGENCGEDDVESIDSDPTELFHRDIATQTSPPQSHTSSLNSSTSVNYIHHDANQTSIQSSRLTMIHNSLASFVASNSQATTSQNATESLKSTVEDLQAYLDNLQFSNNAFNSSYDHIYPSFEVQKSTSKKNKAGDDDEAAKFKAEIRAVKGALLSSRTFPAGRKPVGGIGNIGMVGSR